MELVPPSAHAAPEKAVARAVLTDAVSQENLSGGVAAPAPAAPRASDALPRYEPEGQDCTARYFAHPPLAFMEAYRQLGPIFQCRFIGRDVVAMGGLAANEFIWGRNELWDYHATNAHFREQFDATYLNQLEGPAFVKKRRRTVQGFKPSVLLEHAPGMSRVLFEEVDALAGREVELRLLCMRLIICMTGRVLMQTKLPPGLDRTMAISNRDMLRAPTLGRWRHLFYLKPTRLWRRRRIFRFLGRLLDERASNPAAREDILSLILAAHPAGEPPIPRQELIYDLSQLFMAGSTTTSQVILWTLLYLHQHPAWAAELREELRAWDPFNFAGMAAFPKLRATLLEIERLSPPGATVTRIAARDFSFGGYRVKQGTPVLHLQTLCHYLPEVYADPLAFRPQRFLDDPSLPPKFAHGLFGGGNHGCVGQPLVRVLTPMLVANLVTHYDLVFRDPVSLEGKLDVVFTPAAPQLWARLIRR
jgi:cytochrome P450